MYDNYKNIESKDLKCYAWIIETSSNNKKWQSYFNRKIYMTEDIAKNALISIKSTGGVFSKVFFRITPLYIISDKLQRNITIDDIID